LHFCTLRERALAYAFWTACGADGPSKTPAPCATKGTTATPFPRRANQAGPTIRSVSLRCRRDRRLDLDIGSGHVEWTSRNVPAVGFEPGEVVPSYALFLRAFIPPIGRR